MPMAKDLWMSGIQRRVMLTVGTAAMNVRQMRKKKVGRKRFRSQHVASSHTRWVAPGVDASGSTHEQFWNV